MTIEVSDDPIDVRTGGLSPARNACAIKNGGIENSPVSSADYAHRRISLSPLFFFFSLSAVFHLEPRLASSRLASPTDVITME